MKYDEMAFEEKWKSLPKSYRFFSFGIKQMLKDWFLIGATFGIELAVQAEKAGKVDRNVYRKTMRELNGGRS